MKIFHGYPAALRKALHILPIRLMVLRICTARKSPHDVTHGPYLELQGTAHLEDMDVVIFPAITTLLSEEVIQIFISTRDE